MTCLFRNQLKLGHTSCRPFIISSFTAWLGSSTRSSRVAVFSARTVESATLSIAVTSYVGMLPTGPWRNRFFRVHWIYVPLPSRAYRQHLVLLHQLHHRRVRLLVRAVLHAEHAHAQHLVQTHVLYPSLAARRPTQLPSLRLASPTLL